MDKLDIKKKELESRIKEIQDEIQKKTSEEIKLNLELDEVKQKIYERDKNTFLVEIKFILRSLFDDDYYKEYLELWSGALFLTHARDIIKIRPAKPEEMDKYKIINEGP